MSRLAEPVEERLVDEAVALVAVDIGDRNAQRVELALRKREQASTIDGVADRMHGQIEAIEGARKGHGAGLVGLGRCKSRPVQARIAPTSGMAPPTAAQARFAPRLRHQMMGLRHLHRRRLQSHRQRTAVTNQPSLSHPLPSPLLLSHGTRRPSFPRVTLAGPCVPRSLPAAAHAASGDIPRVGPVPVDFILFALTLLGVALFHHHTLRVALIGLAVISAYKVAFTGFKEGPGVGGLVTHLAHEWVILANLLPAAHGLRAAVAPLREEPRAGGAAALPARRLEGRLRAARS